MVSSPLAATGRLVSVVSVTSLAYPPLAGRPTRPGVAASRSSADARSARPGDPRRVVARKNGRPLDEEDQMAAAGAHGAGTRGMTADRTPAQWYCLLAGAALVLAG